MECEGGSTECEGGSSKSDGWFAANNEAEVERAFKFNTILQLKKRGFCLRFGICDYFGFWCLEFGI